MHTITLGEWSFSVEDGALPAIYGDYKNRATLVDEKDINSSEGRPFFISAGLSEGWPTLVIAQRYSPYGGGFDVGLLFVPETSLLFVGAGEDLSCYDLSRPRKLWEDYVHLGFWGWRRYRDFVIMSAELECAVWTTSGKKLWSDLVEPPWDYSIQGDVIELDIMGQKKRRYLMTGEDVK